MFYFLIKINLRTYYNFYTYYFLLSQIINENEQAKQGAQLRLSRQIWRLEK